LTYVNGAEPLSSPSTAPPLRLGDDLASEAAWLARVSDAYARSELVRAILADRSPRVVSLY
jgi:hypothetical protein